MTDTTEAVEGRSEKGVLRGKHGPMGPGNGPMIAAGIMLGGAILFTGWSVGTAMADEGIVQALGGGQSIEAPADPDDEKSVTLPDEDGNGVPDEYEEAEPAEPVAPEPVPEPKPVVYLIEEGDTLTEISAETGVPVDMLVQTNGIQNPNLIFAGSSLLIPPV
jgi:LysM repeat protein